MNVPIRKTFLYYKNNTENIKHIFCPNVKAITSRVAAIKYNYLLLKIKN